LFLLDGIIIFVRIILIKQIFPLHFNYFNKPFDSFSDVKLSVLGLKASSLPAGVIFLVDRNIIKILNIVQEILSHESLTPQNISIDI
jgi:hypothetical protein